MGDSQTRNEYIRRIHRVQDYIEANPAGLFSLEELAGVAGFSKFHFHRIFKVIAGESLWQYVNRIKLEKAAALLLLPQGNVTTAAYRLGFSSPAVFTRAFKNYFGLNPSAYRGQYSKIRKDGHEPPGYNEGMETIHPQTETTELAFSVERLELAEMRLAYVRHTGPYGKLATATGGLYKKLFAYAARHNLFEPGKTKVLVAYHDNPEITEQPHLRTSLCITLPEWAGVVAGDEIGSMTIPAGEYAVGHFDIFQSQFGVAWESMYAGLLANSDCQPGDSFPFEVYLGDGPASPQERQRVDIYVPVEPFGIL